MSEEYSVGYSEGYQAGWNSAMDAAPPAAQRQWVGLTDEERHEIMKLNYARTEWLVHATEAKLKEKNT